MLPKSSLYKSYRFHHIHYGANEGAKMGSFGIPEVFSSSHQSLSTTKWLIPARYPLLLNLVTSLLNGHSNNLAGVCGRSVSFCQQSSLVREREREEQAIFDLNDSRSLHTWFILPLKIYLGSQCKRSCPILREDFFLKNV